MAAVQDDDFYMIDLDDSYKPLHDSSERDSLHLQIPEDVNQESPNAWLDLYPEPANDPTFAKKFGRVMNQLKQVIV